MLRSMCFISQEGGRRQDLLTKTEQRLAHTCGLGLRTKKVKNEKGTHRQQTKQTQELTGREVHKGRCPIPKSTKTQVKMLSHRKTWSLAYKEHVPRSVCPKDKVPLDWGFQLPSPWSREILDVCTRVWKPEVHIGCLPLSLPTLRLETESRWTWSS